MAPQGYVAVSGLEHEPDSKPPMASAEPAVMAAPAAPPVMMVELPHNPKVHRGWKIMAIAQLVFLFLLLASGPPPPGPDGVDDEGGPGPGPGPRHRWPHRWPHHGGRRPGPHPGPGPRPGPPPKAACIMSVKYIDKVCGSFELITEALEAGKITKEQAEKKYAWAHVACANAGKKVAEACIRGPPEPGPPNFFAKVVDAAFKSADEPEDETETLDEATETLEVDFVPEAVEEFPEEPTEDVAGSAEIED